jgi:hypothetical protein
MKTKTIVITVILGCCGLFVVAVAVCGGAFYFIYKNADADVSPQIDRLFAAIDNGTFGDAYLTDTTPEMRAVVSKEKWEQIGKAVKSRLGRLQSKTLTQFNAKYLNADSFLSVAYSATFNKGNGQIRAQFKSVNSQWRLLSIYIDSPLLIGWDQQPAGRKTLSKPHTADSREPIEVKSIEYYEKKLLDKNFTWNGPCSSEDRIPVLHAARALAYIGDPAVPALLRASKNKSIDFISIYDALAEIGLPVHQYLNEQNRGDSTALEKWWAENREKTAAERSKHRKEIGLPPVKEKTE